MNDENLHINNSTEKSESFFSKGKIVWEKSETEVWSEISSKLGQVQQTKRKTISISLVFKFAAAAIVFLVLGLGSVFFFYSKTIVSQPGEHLTAELPDGSTVELNAASELKYYPLIWMFQRKVLLAGEGYFSVQKGKKFEVQSENGSTQVLGTTFNIYSRNNNYRVTCLTGKVKVIGAANQSVILEPDSQAEIENGEFVIRRDFKTERAISWKNNQFYFTGTPLKEVIDEIERQYAVTINIQPELDNRNFAGNFPKKYNVEEVLDFVCKTMQIKFIKQTENVFLVVEKS